MATIKVTFLCSMFRLLLSNVAIKLKSPKWAKALLFVAITHLASAQGQIVFVSDTQKPMWVEGLFLPSHHNEKATELIFQSIQSAKPQSVFILGDVVSLGHKEKKWKKIDAYLHQLRSSGMEVDALLGNHDVMSKPKKGEQVFQTRFPHHQRLGYIRFVDSLAIVLLNSNFKTLTATDRLQQKKWLEQQLTELDQAPKVQFVIVACHHAPYTNSKIVRSSMDVQQDFVPAYLKSTKAVLFITGHSHNFEHFLKNGKHFLVIGGGGGIHQPTRTSTAETDDLAKEYKPLFHYLITSYKAKKIYLKSIYLSPDFKRFETGYQLTIPLQ